MSLIEGPIKKKGSKFGFWHKQYFKIQGSDLLLLKKASSTNPERIISLQADTKVDFVPDSDERFIVIQPLNEEPVVLASATSKKSNDLLHIFRQVTICSTNLTMQSFKIVSVLGRGYYGKVLLCRRINTDSYYAIKTVKKSRLIEFNKIHTVFAEKNALMITKHPFIVQFHFAFQTPSKLYLGLEYIPGGELNNHLQQVGRIPINDVRIYIAEIALALNYLHSLGIIYRDLKPENILLAADGHVKMTDFGLTKVGYPDQTASTFCGTSEYISPEMIRHELYNKAVDWWALGILAYELSMGITPFKRSNQIKMFKAITSDEPTFGLEIPDDLKDLIIHLLNKNPKERYTFSDIKKHPFFKDISWSEVYDKHYQPSYIPDLVRSNDNLYLNPSSSTESFSNECPADSFSTPVGEEQDLFQGFSFVEDPNSISDSVSSPIAENSIPLSNTDGNSSSSDKNLTDNRPSPEIPIAESS